MYIYILNLYIYSMYVAKYFFKVNISILLYSVNVNNIKCNFSFITFEFHRTKSSTSISNYPSRDLKK